MITSAPKIRQACYVLAALSFTTPSALADLTEATRELNSHWYVQVGGYTHYSDDEEYEGTPWFAGIEFQKPTNWVVGLSVFDNSFGDFTQYVYLGKSFHPSDKYPGFRIKLTAGLAHGYRGDHHKIMPIRWGDSWGLGVVPTVGYQARAVGVDVALLSASGLLFLVGYEF